MIQKRYEGFLNTPYLWKADTVFNLNQFELRSQISKFNYPIDSRLRLGKYIERFVSFELTQHEDVSVLAENIQIQKDKTTLGEIDCLLLKDNKPIHLEIIYKFYVYDPSVGTTEIEHLIGPNRKDSLLQKLAKLSQKQLPLLYSNECKPYLNKLGLKANTISQYVYFKAQLFLPITSPSIEFKSLNHDCIVGFYINPVQLDQFKDCKFYIPQKKDWLVKQHFQVDWLNYEQFKNITNNYLEKQYSSLFWLKHKNGQIKKMFLVWWTN